ncbi:MAG: hypothetical protein K2P42_15365 [Lachnospiraceae bacterium]|jgi:hypothetical protein|nr:hypothetical protein [Lachnospiraceae bacterium]
MKRLSITAILMCVVLLSSCGQGGNLQQGESLDTQSGSLQTSEQARFSFEGTVFHYGNHDYDVSARNQSINSILSAVPVGQKIVIKCHVGPKNGVYCIFDTESESFDEDIIGNNLIWHSDDIATSVYSFWSEVHTYDGGIVKTYDLAEDALIYDLKFSDDCTKLDVTIVHDDGTDETDTITLLSE